MSHFSALIGFDAKSLSIKAPFSHYSVKAIIVVDEDLYFESQTSLLAISLSQGVVEVNFQMFKPNPVLLLELCLYQTFETQLYQREFRCYHAEQQLEFLSEPENIVFKRGKEDIYTECAVTGIEFDAMTCLPLVELNLSDFRMPKSGLMFSAHYAVEIETDTFKLVKYLGSRQGDLSCVVLPFEQEFLVKVIYVMQIYGTQHIFTICNARVQNNQALIRGALFEITDIDCKLGASVFVLIDTLSDMVANAIDEARDELGNKIKLSAMMNPQFLQRFILLKNPKLLTVNLPKFQAPPPVVEADDKKLQKIIDEEILMCEDLARQNEEAYNQCELTGSVFIVLQTFPATQKVEEHVFRDLEKAQKSVAMAGVKINRKASDFGFAIISNKEINIQKCIQQFEVGTGNLAYCNPTDTKQFLQLMHRTNYCQVVKLLANSSKSLIEAAKEGLTLHAVVYEQSAPFNVRNIKFSQKEIENGISEGFSFLEERLSANSRLRIYIEDLFYCEKHELAAAEAPEESILIDNGNNQSVEEELTYRASFNVRASFVSRIYNPSTYDPARCIDYFGQKIKQTQFCVCNKYVKTFREFITEAEEQARVRAEQEALEAERKRLEEERLQQEEEEKRIEEELEQQRIEEERLEEERRIQEQLDLERQECERIAEQKRLEEQERQKQIEQLKFMQMRRKFGGGAPKKVARRTGSTQRRREHAPQVELGSELLNMRFGHAKKEEERNDKLGVAIKQNKARLRELEIEFEKETTYMQYELEQAYLEHEMLASAADDAEESDDHEFQEQLALELFRAQERLEKEQDDALLKMDEQYKELAEKDEDEALARKERAIQRLEEEQRREQELCERARRRQEAERQKYEKFVSSRKMYHLGQSSGVQSGMQPDGEQSSQLGDM